MLKRVMSRSRSMIDFDEMVGLRALGDRDTASVPPLVPVGVRRSELAPPPIAPLASPTTHSRLAASFAVLWIEEPARSPRRVTLPVHHAVRVGRSTQTDVPIADLTASRHHAVVWFDGDQVTIVDDLSRNGLLFRGSPASGEVALTPGVAVQIGRTKLLRAVRPYASDERAFFAIPGMVAQARRLAATEL